MVGRIFLLLSLGMLFFTCTSTKKASEIASTKDAGFFVNRFNDTIPKLMLTPQQWKKRLSPQQYKVMRENGTEAANSSDLVDNKKAGLYTCAACGLTLFSSSAKFDSGTGWPSFSRADDISALVFTIDNNLGYYRTAIACAKCESHLGHVFDDGPPPSRKRYCINGLCLQFVESLNGH